MISSKRRFGDQGENLAVDFLKSKGLKILDRNYLLKTGEIDIVAARTCGFLDSKFESIRFVEVKTVRKGFSLSFAAQNVHFKKRQRLIKSAQIYLLQKNIDRNIPWQIDVVLLSLDDQGSLTEIDYLENAVF